MYPSHPSQPNDHLAVLLQNVDDDGDDDDDDDGDGDDGDNYTYMLPGADCNWVISLTAHIFACKPSSWT